MELTFTLGNVISVIVFIGGLIAVIKKSAGTEATMAEQIKTLFKQHKDMKDHDDVQDARLAKLDDKTTKVVTTVAVIDERTKHIEASGVRMEKSLAQLLARKQ